jgi:hypothetical protein
MIMHARITFSAGAQNRTICATLKFGDKPLRHKIGENDLLPDAPEKNHSFGWCVPIYPRSSRRTRRRRFLLQISVSINLEADIWLAKIVLAVESERRQQGDRYAGVPLSFRLRHKLQ